MVRGSIPRQGAISLSDHDFNLFHQCMHDEFFIAPMTPSKKFISLLSPFQ
ncbi:hypothetical protein OAD58_00520 [Gammaproteobacteria bacterium]|nr:hypothetical protein [Gammaproteobacteria bacterium]